MITRPSNLVNTSGKVQVEDPRPALIRSVTMKVVSGVALLLVNLHLSRCCSSEGQLLICQEIPTAFTPGFSSLVMLLNNVGEINSTVLRSDHLASITRLRIDNAGVTGIAVGAFSSFQNLKNLSLNQNLLTEINPNWFARPDILSELNLTGNHIEGLNEFMLKGLSNLTRLSLNMNRIRTIDVNSFSSQVALAELDLSKNRMTLVSPQVFSSLRSTRISLDGNPWNCSCGAEHSVDFLKDLHRRSLLDRPMEVTCETPPYLKGRPVWNVSVCVTSPPPEPPSVTQTVHPKPTEVETKPLSQPTSKTETPVQPKPTGIFTTVPTSAVVTKPSPQLTSETETSVQPKPTDAPPINSSYTATTPVQQTPETKTSVRPKPTDILTSSTTPALKTETCVTSQPSSDTNIICTLIAVIALLSSLLFLVCFLVVLHRRKHNNKTVMPGSPRENTSEPKEEDSSSRSSPAQSSGDLEKRENNQWDSEVGCRRSFNGVRAKSASAVLFTAPFWAPVTDQVTSQTEAEAQVKDEDNKADGKHKLSGETNADGGFETGNQTNTTDVNVKQAADEGNLDKGPHVPVSTDTAPYLSIGANQNKPGDFNKQFTDVTSQRSQRGKVMGRISTWPPTAVQWQARCKMMEKEEEGFDVFTVWTPKLPGEVKKVLNEKKNHFGEEEIEKNQIEDPLKLNVTQMKVGNSQSPKPTDDKTAPFNEAHDLNDMKQVEQLKKEQMIQDPAAVRQKTSETRNLKKLAQTRDLRPAEQTINKSTNKTEAKRAETSRQRAENRGTSSKAPSGGASPDDETLLSGNEYAFMDLLHEVVQNNGRWTRERWRQIHANKQRR